jgi:hypothetical protein
MDHWGKIVVNVIGGKGMVVMEFAGQMHRNRQPD